MKQLTLPNGKMLNVPKLKKGEWECMISGKGLPTTVTTFKAIKEAIENKLEITLIEKMYAHTKAKYKLDYNKGEWIEQ